MAAGARSQASRGTKGRMKTHDPTVYVFTVDGPDNTAASKFPGHGDVWRMAERYGAIAMLACRGGSRFHGPTRVNGGNLARGG